jgi:hypothetical protein
MWKRIIWDILAIALVVIAPWWITLIWGVLGVIFFTWYLEIIILGALYDALFGLRFLPWYQHLIHTGIFTVPLLIIQFVKTRINV